jgi:ribosomal protein S27E
MSNLVMIKCIGCGKVYSVYKRAVPVYYYCNRCKEKDK